MISLWITHTTAALFWKVGAALIRKPSLRVRLLAERTSREVHSATMATSLTRFCPSPPPPPPPLSQKHHLQILLCSLKQRHKKPLESPSAGKDVQTSSFRASSAQHKEEGKSGQHSLPSLLLINKCPCAAKQICRPAFAIFHR